METAAIPAQKKGASFDVSESISLRDRTETIADYEAAKQRLLRVSNWGEIAGEDPGTFVLTDRWGKEIGGDADEGDLIKIHLPGPRNLIGGGEDWVSIEKIHEEENHDADMAHLTMTIRPHLNPFTRNKAIAHFFGKCTTNTFLVCRHGNKITGSIHGRNEQINTNTDWMDLVRNLLVALPAQAGLSNLHWKRLAKGLINEKEFFCKN
ncbi:MAG: hypothetical protein ACXVA2_22480 [Mucilaginibacter sp.]